MVSHLFYYQLALLAILWLFVMLHVTWSESGLTTPAVPAKPKRTRLSLSRFNHRLPGCEAHPEVVQGTAQFHHEITPALLPQPDPVFHNATALHATVDMLKA
jgi:hypothetical protein